jgi:hypothetical protein
MIKTAATAAECPVDLKRQFSARGWGRTGAGSESGSDCHCPGPIAGIFPIADYSGSLTS